MSTRVIALRIAEQAHLFQKRKNGESYINHPKRVAEAAYKKMQELNLAEFAEEAFIVGLLHDVLEDSKEFSIGDLEKAGFSVSILTSLCVVTKTSTESYLNYILNIKEDYSTADKTYYSGYLSWVVKLCDLEDNLNGATGTLKDKYEMAKYILEAC